MKNHSKLRIAIMLSTIFTSSLFLGCQGDNNLIGSVSSEIESNTSEINSNSEPQSSLSEEVIMKSINIYVGDKAQVMELSDNQAAKEFYQKVKEEDVIVDMSDYGDFEKVGSLGFSITSCDEYITTSPGDVILYMGNKITIYYDVNSWNFTLLGKIKNMTRDTMLSFLDGKGSTCVRFSTK